MKVFVVTYYKTVCAEPAAFGTTSLPISTAKYQCSVPVSQAHETPDLISENGQPLLKYVSIFRHFQDPSASRYIMDFSFEKVFVESDTEFAVFTVKVIL